MENAHLCTCHVEAPVSLFGMRWSSHLFSICPDLQNPGEGHEEHVGWSDPKFYPLVGILLNDDKLLDLGTVVLFGRTKHKAVCSFALAALFAFSI